MPAFLYRLSYFLSEARPLINIFCFLAVPLFAILAYRAWSKTLRLHLTSWRNAIALTSLLAVSLNWLWVAFLLLLHLINERWPYALFSDTAWGVLFLSALTSALLAGALKGLARVQGIAAGVFMAAFWATSFVE